MPCIVKVKVRAARNLPVMDEATGLADAYVEVKLGDQQFGETDIARKTLSPVWQVNYFRQEVSDDGDVQDSPLELKVWDHDRLTDDVIGSVHIDLNVLFMATRTRASSAASIAGWFPIYDTLRGVCGELSVVVKVELIGNLNPFGDSSAGVLFFSASRPAPTRARQLRLVQLLGFVEDLVMDDDPEYHWTDTFRTPRSSNDARQMLFFQLSGMVRRQLGRKVLEMGGNAVVGFHLHYDFEQEYGIVVRAYGTAAIVRTEGSRGLARPLPSPAPSAPNSPTRGGTRPAPSLADAVVSGPSSYARVQLLSVTDLPVGVLLRLGGIVATSSVKLISARGADTTAVRDAWWSEIRDEIRSHALALGCYFVIGYSEQVAIRDEVVVLTAVGTAVVLRLRHPLLDGPFAQQQRFGTGTVDDALVRPGKAAARSAKRKAKRRKQRAKSKVWCSVAHIPYSVRNASLQMKVHVCAECKRKFVPPVLLSSMEPPKGLPIVGEGTHLEVRVIRMRGKKHGKDDAEQLSELLPFVLYDIHRQLLIKLKVKGMNAAFGFSLSLDVSATMVVAMASATACYLSPLPPPASLNIVRALSITKNQDVELARTQSCLVSQAEHNRSKLRALAQLAQDAVASSSSSSSSSSSDEVEAGGGVGAAAELGYLDADPLLIVSSSSSSTSSSSSLSACGSGYSSDDEAGLHRGSGGAESNTVALEVDVNVDDDADRDLLAVLLDPLLPDGVRLCTTMRFPGSRCTRRELGNVSLITVVKRISLRTSSRFVNQELAVVFRSLYASLVYKASRMRPVQVVGLRSSVSIASSSGNQITAVVTGMIVKELRAPVLPPIDLPSPLGSFLVPDELLPRLEYAAPVETGSGTCSGGGSESSRLDDDDDDRDGLGGDGEASSRASLRRRGGRQQRRRRGGGSGARTLDYPRPDGPAITLTPLAFVPGKVVQEYLGRLSLSLIREFDDVSEKGGNGAVTHLFVSEAKAMLRGRVASLGGNALTSTMRTA
ncbi:uncharacterized protein AMSG_00631 [Thecamonas trahens ATCC 50062]|uniref:C2 domain-containing protein n=1 Tax=Thecamonas trahens ATCC 50062 TaxID=461836 RepID=A0A0L0DGK6_THETB|nr:hypothetical protein AMSG_00631 [Thecamonas trahens ATCC 50062]KNC50468.1 hypothetical protein AMSG_00631 [Thecamonas trahens ATCC 50062]|eukprot:XP_013762364.1 hypothetical protein AMSG_00631 [Thecamonas trahens ATCC 50062]